MKLKRQPQLLHALSRLHNFCLDHGDQTRIVGCAVLWPDHISKSADGCLTDLSAPPKLEREEAGLLDQ